MTAAKTKRSKYTKKHTKEIIKLFHSLKNNTSVNISKISGIQITQVNKVLTIYLSGKMKRQKFEDIETTFEEIKP